MVDLAPPRLQDHDGRLRELLGRDRQQQPIDVRQDEIEQMDETPSPGRHRPPLCRQHNARLAT
jgi:hypothetical protein